MKRALVLLALLPGCGLLLDPVTATDDGGPGMDAARFDAGPVDGGRRDAGHADAGRVDAGRVDAGPVDAGRVDAGPVDAGRVDAGPADASVPDASGPPDGDVCIALIEVCNDRDDDCDGAFDEGFDVDTDRFNCGDCGVVCEGPNPFCVGGVCGFVCAPGTDDCTSAPFCETNLRLPENCGACGNVCEGPTPLCDFVPGVGGGCTGICTAPLFECDDECVDLARDSRHCGGCERPCTTDQPHCARPGNCTPCPPGFGDCNLNPLDGCEVDLNNDPDHCNGCNIVCEGTCGSGICTAVAPEL